MTNEAGDASTITLADLAGRLDIKTPSLYNHIRNLDDLHEALEDGRLAGVGLDVFEPEPPDFSHPIFRHPDCLTAPHSIANSKYSTHKIHQTMAEDMAAVLRGERPRFVVNPEVFD